MASAALAMPGQSILYQAACRGLSVQIVGMVVAGARPSVPPREQLPGIEAPPPASLEAYSNLMR